LLKRSTKTDRTPRQDPLRILVVDDNPDAGLLMVKLFRRAGYEVAEVSDHDVALATLINEPQPIAAVVASFSGSGTGSCLKLLDAIRNHMDPRVKRHRMVLIIDSPRQQMLSWQAGADEIILRPYHANGVIVAAERAITRADDERPMYRRRMIDQLAANPVI
jgi:DNA-binding response OmpR family regulator